MGLLNLLAFGSCNTAKKEKIKVADNCIPESYGNSLIGKELFSVKNFELYDKPDGKVILICDYNNDQGTGFYGYSCEGCEIQGDWIRLKSVSMITIGELLPSSDLPSSGWAKWKENEMIVFKVFE